MTWVQRDADKARQIVIGLRKPVRRIRLVNFAYSPLDAAHRLDPPGNSLAFFAFSPHLLSFRSEALVSSSS